MGTERGGEVVPPLREGVLGTLILSLDPRPLTGRGTVVRTRQRYLKRETLSDKGLIFTKEERIV